MMRHAAGLLLAMLCAAGSAEDNAAPATSTAAFDDLDQVMHLLALRRHGRVEFVEQHFLAVLKRPIESSGELRYDAPDHLEKRTILPRSETLVADGSELTIERNGRRHVVDLQRYPKLQPLIESIRGTLAGDRGALERLFHLEFAGSVERWSLALVPRDDSTAHIVKQIQIDGAREQLLRVEIRQPDGDRSLMTLRAPAKP
jgi:hypothetical protein